CAFCIITIKPESARTYGITFVTTARLTRALNCSLRLGDMVDKAITDWTTPITTIPATGASMRFTFEKTDGNIRSSEADFAVCEIVNCQPKSDPRHAITAKAMTTDPIVGLNILAYAKPNGPVDSTNSALGMMP